MSIVTRIPNPIIPFLSPWKKIHENTVIKYSSIIALVSILVAFLVLLIFFRRLPPEVPLWFCRPWGQDRLASPSWLFLLPAVSFVWYVVDVLFIMYLTAEYLVFSQILIGSSTLVAILSLISLVKIIAIVM